MWKGVIKSDGSSSLSSALSCTWIDAWMINIHLLDHLSIWLKAVKVVLNGAFFLFNLAIYPTNASCEGPVIASINCGPIGVQARGAELVLCVCACTSVWLRDLAGKASRTSWYWWVTMLSPKIDPVWLLSLLGHTHTYMCIHTCMNHYLSLWGHWFGC